MAVLSCGFWKIGFAKNDVPTSYPNIAYSVVEYNVEETEAVCQLVAEKLEQYPAPAKIIVYSSSIETIEELGSKEALNCHAYYTNIGSIEEKD